MNRLQTILTTLGLSFSLQAVASDATVKELSLADAIDLTLERSATVQNAYLGRMSDKYSFEVARDQYRPQFSVSSSNSRDRFAGTHEEGVSLDSGMSLQLLTGGSLSVTSSNNGSLESGTADFYSSQLSINFSQPLLSGGGLKVGSAPLTFARRSLESSYLSFRAELIDAVTDMIKTYREYQLTLQSLDIQYLSLARSHKQLEMNTELVEAGRLPGVDLIQSQTDVANQELDYRSAVNDAEIARLNFLRRLRLDTGLKVVLSTPIDVKEPISLDLEAAISMAKENRPDYLQALISMANAELSVDLSKNNQLWDLSLNVNYGMSGQGISYADAFHDINGFGRANRSITLDLSIPINDKSRRQELIDSEIGLAQQRNALSDLEFSIRTEMMSKLQSLSILWQQVTLAGKSLDLSRRQLELEQEKLASGRTTSFQVVRFQNDLIEAENRHAGVRVSYLNAVTDLNQSLGRTLAVWDIDVARRDADATLKEMSRFAISKSGF